MTITHRKRAQVPDEVQIVNEPGTRIQCDGCMVDLTHSIRIKCADPACEAGDGLDICPGCFCAGKEFKQHKRGHSYRVVELHSYPIFVEDWGADEDLLLLEGIALQGLGNWQAVSEHVGTRTKEEVEEHYTSVYINSPNWPLPRMDAEFDIDHALFQDRKRRRISSMNNSNSHSHVVKPAPTSAPGVHEIATFLPGRLEFEHELDNEAEDLIKDLEFGVVEEYGGAEIPVDVNDPDVLHRKKLAEERKLLKEEGLDVVASREMSATPGLLNGSYSGKGSQPNGDNKKEGKADPQADDDPNAEEPTLPPPYETRESLDFKLSLLEMYFQRVEKRLEGKAIMFDRGLLEYKKMQAQEKKRPKEEKDIVHRLRPLAKLMTAEDYEQFVEGILYESVLRKRIQELQFYRRMGLTTPADIEKYDLDLAKRAQVKANLANNFSQERLHLRPGSVRGSTGPDPRRASAASLADSEDTPSRPNLPGSAAGAQFRKQPAALNLANSPYLHLLTAAEQALCSKLRILPRPYLAIKETIVREFARSGGTLRRRDARDLVKIDVNKTSMIWDFLVFSGVLKVKFPEDEGSAPAFSAIRPGAGGPSRKTLSPQKGGLPTAPPSISPSQGSLPLFPSN